MAREPLRARVSRDLGAGEARADAPASGLVEGDGGAIVHAPQAARAAPRVVCAVVWKSGFVL